MTRRVEEDRVGEYEMKLMDIDQEHLGIPDTQYDATVSMSSAEFARICRDLAVLGESVKIECSKEGVTFSADGEVGKGSVLLRQNAGQDRSRVKNENEIDEDEEPDIKPKTKRGARRDPDEDDEDGQKSDVDVKPDIEGGQLKFPLHIYVANPCVEDELQEEEEQEEGEERLKKRKAGAKKDKVSLRNDNHSSF